MSNTNRHAVLGNRFAVLMVLVLACLATVSCDDDDGVLNTSGPFSLQFSLGSDFQGPFGGDPISWGLYRSEDGVRVASGEGVISPTTNPAFTLVTSGVMDLGVPHEIRYWIDSNIGGGTPGVCDAETVDEQWITQFAGATGDLVFLAIYDQDAVQDVCGSFTP